MDLRIPNFAPPPDFQGQMSAIQEILMHAQDRRIQEERAKAQEARYAEIERHNREREAGWDLKNQLAQQKQDALEATDRRKLSAAERAKKIELARKGITLPGDRMETRSGPPPQQDPWQPDQTAPITPEDEARLAGNAELNQSGAYSNPWEQDPEQATTSSAIDSELTKAFDATTMRPEFQGSMHEIPQKQKRILVTTGEDGNPEEIDMTANIEADAADASAKLSMLEEQMASATEPSLKLAYANEIAKIRTGLSPDVAKAMLRYQDNAQRAKDRTALEGTKQQGRMEVLDKRHSNKIAEIERAAELRKKKSEKSAQKYISDNKPIDQQLEPKERNQILSQFRATEIKVGRLDKVIQSYRRLKAAEMEIKEPNTPEARFAKLETFLNQFGVIREGVPVKHETDFAFVNSFYESMKMKLSGMVGKPIPDSIMKQVSTANRILMTWVEKNVKETVLSVKEGYDGFSQPARKYAQNLGNSVLAKADMSPVQIWDDTPLSSSKASGGNSGKQNASTNDVIKAMMENLKKFNEAKE